ncbi:MAG: hypothetical protein WCT12_02680 [Verrucomicrobiota bacterium]
MEPSFVIANDEGVKPEVGPLNHRQKLLGHVFKRLEQVSNDLQDRFAWRVILRTVVWLLLALGIGLCIGHYWIH